MTANEAFDRCWNGTLEDVSSAWFRAAESLTTFGDYHQARIARIEYIKSLPIHLSNRTIITTTGKLIKSTSISHQL